jgi:signal transduction histidine kinase
MDFWNFTPISILYITAAGVAFFLSFISWKKKLIRASKLFSIMMLSLGVWVSAYILDIFSTNYPWKLLMIKFQYLGMACAVYLWIVFIATYTHFDNWLSKPALLVLAIIPAGTSGLMFLGPHTDIIYSAYKIHVLDGIVSFERLYGWGFYIWTSYSYTVLIIGLIFILIRSAHLPIWMRKQLNVIIPAVIIILIPNMLYIGGVDFMAPFDPTPLALVAMGALTVTSMNFHRFLDAVPLAHEYILRNMKSVIVIIDRRLLVAEVNSMAEQVLLNSEKELLGKHIFSVIPELRELIKEKDIKLEIKSELILGKEKHSYEVNINPLFDSGGNFFGNVIMLWDITDQKEVMEDIDAYARTVAHDLKTPIGIMMGYATIIRDGLSDGADKNKYLERIITDGEKLINIVDGLLFLARLRKNDKPELMEIDVDVVFENTQNRLATMIEEREANIIQTSVLHMCKGDKIWLEEVWVNLISNAIKYGGTPPVIEVGSDIMDDRVKYWVRDNGAGLDSAHKKTIFYEFQRVHDDKNRIEGHGIGLSLVRKIIYKMGGEVGVYSNSNGGSTFYFILPHK